MRMVCPGEKRMRVGDEVIVDDMRMDKGCIPHIVICEYYYQEILHTIDKQPFHMYYVYLAAKLL